MSRRILIMLATVSAWGQSLDDMEILGEVSLTGPSYKSVLVSGSRVQACVALCSDDEYCSAFTVSPERSGMWRCELKKTVGARKANQAGFLSGIKRSGPEGTHLVVSSAKPVASVGGDLPPELVEMVKKLETFEGNVRAGGGVVVRPRGQPETSTMQARPTDPRITSGPTPAPGGGIRLPQLQGVWMVVVDGKQQVIAVTQNGDTATFRDSNGAQAEGRIVGKSVAVPAWQAQATISDSERELTWSNGTVWRRN